jgi:hypothetical protein
MMKAVNVRTKYKEGKVMVKDKIAILGLTMVKGKVEIDGDGMGKCWVANLTGDAVTIGHGFVVGHMKGWVQDEEEEKDELRPGLMEDPNARIDWSKISINEKLNAEMKDQIRKLIIENKECFREKLRKEDVAKGDK